MEGEKTDPGAVPAAAPPAPNSLATLAGVMAALRQPETGCPWDIEQTFETIAPYTIEEAYEVADAIHRNDLVDLKDELGDLLLQVVYHAQMASEEKAFALDDVIEAVTAKMIRRHPHVFGDAATRAAGAPKGFWERIKAEEKAAKSAERARLRSLHPGAKSDEPVATSILDDVPTALPSLTRAVKLQAKAARVGFDWPSIDDVFAKMREELGELELEMSAHAAANSAQANATSPHAPPPAALREELGDLLFVMANVARHLDIDPEAALSQANAKFVRRFHYIESRLADSGRSPSESSLAEMDALWDEAKARDKSAT
ncbi:MAG TPA: nucleoside triphosphate pyrophosphohydrolase [Hyphomicrobiaceae bacterium]|nr:nucleoside triphosphate pyrophosphohydrolase [Hyphomicrobiaceae bacterium]